MPTITGPSLDRCSRAPQRLPAACGAGRHRYARDSAVIHADIDRTEFVKIIAADVALHGDLSDTLRALVDELANGHVPRFDDWAAEARLVRGALPSDRVGDGVLSATDALDRFSAAVPRDAILTTDVGQHQMWAAQRAR